MKTLLKISTLLLVMIISPLFISNTHASTSCEGMDDAMTITVSEDLSPLYCGCEASTDGNYTCKVPKGFGAIKIMMGSIIKYFTFIAGLGAVLFIVVNGVLYSMSGINDSMKTDAKNRITKTLLGLIVLLLSGVILNLIAPWVYKL